MNKIERQSEKKDVAKLDKNAEIIQGIVEYDCRGMIEASGRPLCHSRGQVEFGSPV